MANSKKTIINRLINTTKEKKEYDRQQNNIMEQNQVSTTKLP